MLYTDGVPYRSAPSSGVTKSSLPCTLLSALRNFKGLTNNPQRLITYQLSIEPHSSYEREDVVTSLPSGDPAEATYHEPGPVGPENNLLHDTGRVIGVKSGQLLKNQMRSYQWLPWRMTWWCTSLSSVICVSLCVNM